MSDTAKYRVDTITKVTVVGAGLIGASWAAYFAKKGLDVSVYDPFPETEPTFQKSLSKALDDLSRLNPKNDMPQGNVTFTSKLQEALEGCDYVQENGPEKINIKQELLREIDALVDTDILIGSSTSSFMCSDLQAKCLHANRIFVAHPFNPPHLIPLVELGAGKKTSPHAIEAAFAFFTKIGKAPIKIKKEAVGHVANRLTSALWREAVHIVAEGIATVSDVDRAISSGPGLRWAINGPHILYHMGGGEGGIKSYLEHLGPAQEARWATLGSPTLSAETCKAIIDGVDEEAAGRSLDDLCNSRDDQLIAMLQALTPSQKEGA